MSSAAIRPWSTGVKGSGPSAQLKGSMRMPIGVGTMILDPLILNGVTWQGTYELGPFAIIGQRSRKSAAAPALTVIGDGACIGSHTVIYEGNRIGKHLATGHHVLIREDNQIGDDVSVGSGSVIEHHVLIGCRVRLHSNVFIPEFSVLEDDCWLGPNVVLTNAKYPQSPGVKQRLSGPIVGSHAKIGANTTILPGVRIGPYALVGAGAVVTRDVDAYAVVAGNPARVLKSVKDLPYDMS
jgi:acetyltransferase-like isoleucine patch superfamily enzyme